MFWRFLYAPIIPFKALVCKTYDSIYENAIIETKDIITASTDKFEIQNDNNIEGKGNIIMNALDIFK